MEFLFKGLLIGFSVAAPVGPIGILCIQRSLLQGRRAGLLTGLGAASADLLYGTAAVFGLSAISTLLMDYGRWIRLCGIVFLLYLGLRLLLITAERPEAGQSVPGGGKGWYLSALLLTLSNPLTILAFAGIFAGAGIADVGGSMGLRLQLIAGVFSGSMIWWLFLSFTASIFQGKLNGRMRQWISRGSGGVLVGFALALGVGLLQS